MTRRRKVDASKVIEAVESGRLSKDVMDSYGLEKPQPAGRSRRRGRRSDQPDLYIEYGDVTISKRGSLVIPRSLVEALGLDLEEIFVARKTKAGILIKPMKPASKNSAF